MMKHNLTVHTVFCALAVAAGVTLSLPADAGTPPSGEPPRMMPGEQNPSGQPKDKEPPITLGSSQALLGGLYDELAKVSDPVAAKPVTDVIWKVWNFSGSPTSDVLLERARAATADGDTATALTFLNAVTELQPGYAQGWFLRAMIFKLQNDSHRMLGDLRRAIALDPRHFEALKALALELTERGQKRTAIEAYNKLLQGYPAAAKISDPAFEILARELAGQGI